MPNSATLPRSQLTRRIAADLMRAVWRYRNQTVAALLLMVAAKLSTVLIPLVLKHVVDELGHPVAQALFHTPTKIARVREAAYLTRAPLPSSG